MSSDQNKYSINHLIGNANLPRQANPTLRGTNRRSDPTGGNPLPFFSGLSGTSLTINYTPTGSTVINFVSDGFQAAIDLINAADASNLQASDDDGYLRLTNLNAGGANDIRISAGTAAPILGFRVFPRPGSESFAGEIATSPAGRSQSQDNPHGTALIAGDEEITSEGINRAIIGALLHAERLVADLDLESLEVVEVDAVVQDHPISGERVFRIQDSTLRIPIRGFGISVANPAAGALDDQCLFLEVSGADKREFIELTNTEAYGRVIGIAYDDLTNTIDLANTFTTWGTPDGRSIFNKSATDNKHPSTAIVEIDGDVIRATGATFQTLDCQPGDTLVIESATNTTPFGHNGEFIVTEVLGEDEIRVRPKSAFERNFTAGEIPRSLNANLPGGTSYGNLRVLIGDYISASTLVFVVSPNTISAATHRVRLRVGRRIKETSLQSANALRAFGSNMDRIAELLRIHAITAASFRHAASHIDAPAVAGSPDSLTLGTVEAQLAELLGHINSLIAGQVTYGGGINWVDGTTNPSTDLESQVDKILTDLADAGNDGSAKIRALAAGDLTAGSIRDQLNELDVNWLKAVGRSNTLNGNLLGQSGDTDPIFSTTDAPTGTDFKPLWAITIGSAGGRVRLYSSEDGIFFTVNASWNGSTLWVMDNASSTATLFFIGHDGQMRFQTHEAAVSFANSAWQDFAIFDVLSDGADPANMEFRGQLKLERSIDAGAGPNWEQGIDPLILPGFATALSSARETLVAANGNTAAAPRIHYFEDNGLGWDLTVGARWNAGTSQWEKVATDDIPVLVRLQEASVAGAEALAIAYHNVAATAFADSAWSNFLRCFEDTTDANTMKTRFEEIVETDNDFRLRGTAIIDMTNSPQNPSRTNFEFNKIFANSIVKAWGHLVISQAPLTLTIEEAHNLGSVQFVGQAVEITYDVAFDDALHAPIVWIANMGSSAGNAIVRTNMTVSSSTTLRVEFLDSSGTTINLTTGVVTGRLYYAVFGNKT